MLQAVKGAEDMATNSNGSRGEQTMNVREITSGLENELKLRSEGCASALMRTMSEAKPTSRLLLLQRACQDLSKTKTSPRNANSSAGFRGLNVLSPSPSASSDSSMSGGVPTHMVTTSGNTEMPSRTMSFPSVTLVGPSRQVSALGSAVPVNGIAIGRGSGNMNGGVRNSQACASAVGRGRSSVTSPQTIGSASAVKEKKKRKRPSKKPPTQIIKASPDQFRAKVQELTGMKPAIATPVDKPLPTGEVGRPQPVRTPIVAVPIKVDNDRQNLPARPEAKPEARSEPSSPAMLSSVRSASPISPDRAHLNIVSYRDHSSSSGTSSGKSSLNHTFGFEQDQFPFLEDHQQEHLNPRDDSGLPEEEYNCEDPTLYEVQTRAAVSTRLSFQGLEGNRKEDISNGPERPSGSKSGFGSGSAMSGHSRPSPSEGLERNNRPPTVEHMQMEEDPADYLMLDIWNDWFEHYTIDHYT